eukprot:gene33702-43560_t
MAQNPKVLQLRFLDAARVSMADFDLLVRAPPHNFTGFEPAETALENCVEVLHKVKECNAKEMHEENGDNEQCPKKNMLFDTLDKELEEESDEGAQTGADTECKQPHRIPLRATGKYRETNSSDPATYQLRTNQSAVSNDLNQQPNRCDKLADKYQELCCMRESIPSINICL